MDAHSEWKVLIKLIDVKMSLASYHGDTLDIHTQSFPRHVDKYGIISYVWSHEDNFEVNEMWGIMSTRRTIESCSLASFIGMLDICDQMCMKYIWIDCICVEQENEDMKSLQLAEMGYYYSYATRCLVFLSGLNMYTPPVFGGRIGSWYNRVWVVQEAGYTFGKKTFVFAFPRIKLVESSDIITPLRIRAEHEESIFRCLTRSKRPIGDLEECKVEDISEWALGLVSEENYSDLWKLAVELPDEVRFCFCGMQGGVFYQEKSMLSLDLKPNNVDRILREALNDTRGCKFPEDRIYSIMTLLGIKLDVLYSKTDVSDSKSLRDTICRAAEAMSPEMLVHFVTATWYSKEGHALSELSNSQPLISISHCITDVKVEGSDLLIITTKSTKPVTISCVGDNFYSSQAVRTGWYRSHGHAFLLNDDVKARGEVNLTGDEEVKSRYPVFRSPLVARLLYMGKGSLKGFDIGGDGIMTGPTDEVPANVCLVVCQANAVWVQVGVLHVSEDLIFEPECVQFNLKL